MYKILLVAHREYNAAVRTKAFIISLVLMPVLMGGSVVFQLVMKDKVDTTDKKVAVVDRSGVLADFLVRAARVRNQDETRDPETGQKIRPAFVVEIVPPDNTDPKAQRLRLSESVKRRDLFAFVDIGKDVLQPSQDPQADPDAAVVGYHSKNPVYDDIRNWMYAPINNHVRSLRFAQTDIAESKVSGLIQPVPVKNFGLLSLDEATGAIKDAEEGDEAVLILVPLALMMLMFMMVMMGAMPLINSVLEEKMQRIAEVLLGSVTPFTLMLGKLIGTVGVSLTILGVYIIGAVLATRQMGVAERVPWDVLPWFFVYQVSAIFMFGAVFIAIGAACNDLKEAQSLLMPVWILVMAPLFVWINVVKEPLSSLATGLSLFPPFTPMLMVLRQTTPGGVPVWQPWAGLAGVVAATVLCVWAAGRIFRVGLLMQGKPPKLSHLLRWALSG